MIARYSTFAYLLVFVLSVSATSTSVWAQQPGNLVFYYDFESSSDPVNDASGNGVTASVNGPAAYSGAGAGWNGGQAMDFGEFNNDAFIQIDNPDAFASVTANDAFTISLFQFGGPDSPVDSFTFYAYDEADPNVRQIGSHSPWSNNQIYLDVAGCCGATQRINAVMPEGTVSGEWTHLAFTKNGPRTAIWIDGQEFWTSDDQGGDKAPLGTITTMRIGAARDGDIRSFHGLLDDFAMWDIALTPAEIQSLADVGPNFGVPGDVDGNGTTDRDDFDIISGNMGLSPATREEGNLSGADVDLADFRIWKTNEGCFSTGEDSFECPSDGHAANAAIPEPTALVLAFIAGGGILSARRRR